MRANIKDAEKLISMIDGSRYFNELYLITIGKGLHYAYEGAYSGLLSWVTHTMGVFKHLSFDKLPCFVTKYSNAESRDRFSILLELFCDLYDNFRDNNVITINTLAWYARVDSPEQYQRWHLKRYKKEIISSLMGSSNEDIAKIIYRFGVLDFIYSFEQKKWFYFSNHGWREDIGEEKLRDLFTTRLVPFIIKLIKSFQRKKEDDMVACVKCNKILFKLSSRSYINNIIKCCVSYFGTQHNLDNNPDIIRVTNGVLAISNNKSSIIYRHGIPEDYVSLSTGIEYNCDFTWDHSSIIFCLDWLSELIPDRKSVENFLSLSSNWFRCLNDTEQLNLVGDYNSLNLLLRYTFGDYYNTRIKYVGESNIESIQNKDIINMSPAFLWIISNYTGTI